MPVWMQAVETITGEIDEHGRVIRLEPGDFFQVGRQKAKFYEANGKATLSPFQKNYVQSARALGDCAIVILNDDDAARTRLQNRYPGVTVTSGGYRTIQEARTLFWDTSYLLRIELIPAGFYLLDKGWEIAAPLYSYGKLARDIGNAEDRRVTEEVIHDLRVPVYETRCLFAKNTQSTRALFRQWRDESGDEKLAFFRALYKVKPIICALPLVWQEHR